jgi:hypothetical protein
MQHCTCVLTASTNNCTLQFTSNYRERSNTVEEAVLTDTASSTTTTTAGVAAAVVAPAAAASVSSAWLPRRGAKPVETASSCPTACKLSKGLKEWSGLLEVQTLSGHEVSNTTGLISLALLPLWLLLNC